jgi:hypothetical protein
MRFNAATLLALFFLAVTVHRSALAEVAPSGTDKKCEIATTSIAAASELRQLRQKKEVPCLVRDKESVRANILSLVQEKTPPLKMKYEGLTLKTLGFIPEEFDYERGLIDLYVSQLGGYYDPGRKYFVMAGWMPDILQAPIAVHELTHALQDQYFDLEKFIDSKVESTDLLLARSALVEGDATAVMLDYARRRAGQDGIATEPNVESVMLQNVIGGAFTASMAAVPISLQLTLLFPYTSGLRFVHTLLRRDGYKAVDSTFRNPPRSTTEVLHPERYPLREGEVKEFSDAELRGANKGAVVYRDTVGEFAISTLLAMSLPNKADAVAAANGWAGDRLITLEQEQPNHPTSKIVVTLWRSAWAREGDAAEFISAYERALRQRYGEQFGKNVIITREGKEVLVSFKREIQ